MSTMDYYDDEIFPLSQVTVLSTQDLKCLGTPGACGCSDCEKFKSNRFAKKVLVFGSETGWIWEDETEKKIAEMTAKAAYWDERCGSLNTYCGCDMCNRILIAAQQKGMEEQIANTWKFLHLDEYRFVWNYYEVERILSIKL